MVRDPSVQYNFSLHYYYFPIKFANFCSNLLIITTTLLPHLISQNNQVDVKTSMDPGNKENLVVHIYVCTFL
uniref:Uncharacterized protein n=1 Tax=Aegilops tauschii subsp. strangulata TaxID=200361 RepID=A0A453NGG1_AEGTS